MLFVCTVETSWTLESSRLEKALECHAIPIVTITCSTSHYRDIHIAAEIQLSALLLPQACLLAAAATALIRGVKYVFFPFLLYKSAHLLHIIACVAHTFRGFQARGFKSSMSRSPPADDEPIKVYVGLLLQELKLSSM